MIVALSPGHGDITRFRPWSPIATGNHLDCVEKIPKFSQTTDTVDVFDPPSGISGPTSRRASVCPNLHAFRIVLGGKNVAFLILRCVSKYNNHWALKG